MLDMLSLESVGALQWYKDDVSRFIFFRRRYNYGYDPNMVRKLSMQGDGDIFEEIACHDHHLIESFQCHPSNSPVDLPRRALDLIEEMPNWIKPHLRMVVGTLINERVFSKSTKIGTWSMPNPCSIVGYDPGICLGPFVLNGWISSDPTGKKSFPSDEVRGPRRLAKSKQPVVLSFSQRLRRLLGDDQ